MDECWGPSVSGFVPPFYLLMLVLKIGKSAHSVSMFLIPQGCDDSQDTVV